MGVKELISNYIPADEQEEKDKELFLKYMNDYEDVLTRNNEFAHFTSSAFIVNKQHTKILMIHHNIYNSWTWVGGHADGEDDFLAVAIRETEEETDLKNVKVLSDEIICLDALPCLGHVKRGKYVPAHVHLSVAYLFEADENDHIKIKEDENSNIAWIDMDKIIELSTELYMKRIYEKLIRKVKEKF